MTYLERYRQEHPNSRESDVGITAMRCPITLPKGECPNTEKLTHITCKSCWNQEIPEEPNVTNLAQAMIDTINEEPKTALDFKAAEERVPKGVEMIQPSDDAVLKFDHTGEPIAKVEKVEATDDGVTITTLSCIKDSGTRREFESGAVRDIQEGKGRCDLLPLDVIGSFLNDPIFELIEQFQETANLDYLFAVLSYGNKLFPDNHTMILEISKHFEEGCKKYGENNWRKGIPAKCYIDSAVRHYLKWLRGDRDEPHDRAFIWNIMCCMWTCLHKPELNSYFHKPAEE